MKTIVITGASSGIGYATAKALAKGNRLILCGRRTERLQQLQKELTDTSTLLLTFDVAKKDDNYASFDSLKARYTSIALLPNTACNPRAYGRLQDPECEELAEMIASNIIGVIYITKYSRANRERSTNAHIAD